MNTRRYGICFGLLLLAGLVLAPRGEAQQRGPMGDPAARIDEEMAALTKAVGLADEQVAAIRPIYEDYTARMTEMMEAARGQGQAAMGELRPELAAMRENLHEEVRLNLADDQLDPYAQYIEERQAEMRERRGAGPPSGS